MQILSSSPSKISKIFVAILLCGSLGFYSGCEKFKNYTDVEHIQRAKEFQDKGNLQSATIELKNALQKNAKNAEARWMLGEIYANQGLGKEAEKELKLAEELGINKESLKIPLGNALLQQKEFKRLLSEIEPGPNSSNTNTAKILVLRGEANIGMNNVNDGCASIKQAINLEPNYIPAYYGSARCEGLKGNVQAAREELEKALKINDKNARTWILLGDLERTNNRLPEAGAAYNNSLKIKSDNLDALTGRATTNLQANKLTDAEKDIEAALKLAKGNAIATHLKGILQYRQGKYAEAKTLFETVLKANDDFLPSVLWLGLTNYALKNDEQAIKQLTQYTRAYPSALQIQALLALVQAKLGGKAGAADTLKLLQGINIDDPQSLVAIGQANIMSGESDHAIRSLSLAIEKGSKEEETRVDLAKAYLQKGDSANAIIQLEKAATLDKEPSNADILLIQTHIRQERYDDALKASDRYLAKNISNPRAYNLRGSVFMLQKKTKEAKADFQKALELNPGYPPAAHNLALIAIREENFDLARKEYQRVLEKYPAHLETLLALYDLELALNKPGAANEVLDLAFQKHPTEPAAAIIMASSLLQAAQPLKALEAIREAERVHPNDVGLMEVKVRAQLATGDTSSAIVTQKKLVQLQPRLPDALYRLASMYATSQDRRSAKTAVRQALVIDPKHVKSRVLLGKLALADGNKEEALKIASDLQKADSSAADGQFLEANIWITQNNKRSAKEALDRAVKLQSLKPEMKYELINLYMQVGEAALALPLAHELKTNSPTNDLEALNLLGEVQLAAKDNKNAVRTFEKLAKLAPDSDKINYRLGAAQYAAGDSAAAKASFENVLKQNPKNLEAASALLSIEIRNKNFSQAHKIAENIQKDRPQSPVGPMLRGDVFVAERKFNEAANAFETAYNLRKSGALAIKLHAAYTQVGKADSGYTKLAQWLKNNPNDIVTRIYLAEAYLRGNEFKLAQEQFELLVKQDPSNLLALNNLAWLLHRDKKPEALSIAEKAYRLNPKNPSVLDTLGFILVEQGQVAKGAEYLRSAVKLMPNSSEARYHLAIALVKSGAKAEARKELETIINAGSSTFQQQAKALLSQL